jgi:protein SCO1/2
MSNDTKKWPTPPSPREQIRQRYFPDVALFTQHGKKVRLYEDLVKDKIVVMNFMYTRCTGVCSPVGANLQRVQKALAPRVGRDIFFYSFTLKPEEDTPSVMREYAERMGAGPGWLFLTGTPPDMEKLRRKLGFVDPNPEIDADKSSHTGIIRYGNERLQLWAACPGTGPVKSILNSLSYVDWPEGRRG